MTRFIDNCFLVDNGLIEQITTCPWKGKTSFIDNRRTAGEGAALRFGRHIHAALAFRNRKHFYGHEVDEGKQVRILEHHFMSTPCENEGYRNFENAVKVIKGYNTDPMVAADKSTILPHPKYGWPMVEQPFAIDIPKIVRGRRIIYIGRIDRVVKFPEGVFVRDYKTTSMLGETTWNEAQMSEQLKGYCWALKESTGIEPVGYVYDAIAVRESIQNAIFDEVLGKVIAPPTRSGKPGAAIPLTFESQRFFTKEPAGQLDEWFENMLHQVETFLWHYDRNIFPRHHYHCRGKYGMCEFFNVCSLPKRSRETALNSNAFEENKWSPLYRK
jgi:hypothetical protein